MRVSFSGVSMAARLTGDLRLQMWRGGDDHMLTGRDKAELEWIARGMREALGLPVVPVE